MIQDINLHYKHKTIQIVGHENKKVVSGGADVDTPLP